MNHCQKINYHIYAAEKNEFPLMVDKLLDLIPGKETILRLAFFGMPRNNKEYLQRRAIIHQKVSQHFGDKQPAISYVAQPPLNGALLMEVHSYLPEPGDTVIFKKADTLPYVLVQNKDGRFLYAGGFQKESISGTIQEQSAGVFQLIASLLKKEQFPVNSIIRQWNYIEKITTIEDGNQNYQSFNNARSDLYATTSWENGYPAATGIGSDLGGVLIDLDAALLTSPDTYAKPIDNKLQIAAHAYSGKVLASAQQKKATPKFERAKSICSADKQLIYISGTAAIRGEESLKGVGLAEQLRITIENIVQLTGKATIKMLRVYLKHPDDYLPAKQLMEKYYPGIPISYMCADVCRDELLIEIEGIAQTQ